jgi:hypothetical protein
MKRNNLKESKEILKEDALETGLMLAGFIPVIGEIADIILIARYIYKKEYLYAGLMLIALIPTVGDFIAKPLIKLFRGAKGVLRSGDDLAKFLSKNPSELKKYKEIGKYINDPKISQLIKQVENVPGVGKNIAEGMRKSISEHKSVLNKLGGKSEVSISTRPFTDYFQNKSLAKYMEKKGVTTPPSNAISYWWNITRSAKGDRMSSVKKIITTSNILDMFGLPSFESFQHKIETDEDFRNKLANSPEFGDVISKTTNQEELPKIYGGDNTSSNDSSSGGIGMSGLLGLLGGGAMLSGDKGLNFLKSLAKRIA